MQFIDWICDEWCMVLIVGGDVLYMYCLFVDIGVEVSLGVMKCYMVNVVCEVNWKVYVIMVLLVVVKVIDLVG